MPLQKKEKAYEVCFYGSNTSCGLTEIGDFSHYLDSKDTDFDELVFAMTDLPGWKRRENKNDSGEDYGDYDNDDDSQFTPHCFNHKHTFGAWNSGNTGKNENEKFIEALKKAGWQILEPGKGPHGGILQTIMITPEARDKYLRERKKNAGKRKNPR